MRKPVIAIDGFSSTGKSSISKVIAQKLGLIHLDTGALYRGITLFAIQNCMDQGTLNMPLLFRSLAGIDLGFRLENEELVLYLNGVNVSEDIRQPEISDQVSLIAKQPEVREFLLDTQRNIAAAGGVIMDGRDIGTVVLPDADYKFFLTASVDERTERRYLELKHLGIVTDKLSVKENLISRDKTDSERKVAPLKKADDAVVIDNTELNKNETIDLILSYIKEF